MVSFQLEFPDLRKNPKDFVYNRVTSHREVLALLFLKEYKANYSFPNLESLLAALQRLPVQEERECKSKR
jgi:hypothetical protein